MRKQSASAAEKGAVRVIEVQKAASTALRLCNNNRVDAMAWLARDWERAMESIVAQPGEEAKITAKMKVVEDAIEYLKNHPDWDGTVMYNLIRPDVK